MSVANLVKTFAQKPFIQRALAAPKSPQSVLSFYFGVDYDDSSHVKSQLEQGNAITEMTALWFGGGPEFDELCQPFGDVVKASGTNQLTDDWQESVEGLLSQVVLCDQLSRNIFRGDALAYAFDDKGLECARLLADHVFDGNGNGNGNGALQGGGPVYAPYFATLVLPFMHSELIADHEMSLRLLEHAKATTPDSLQEWWNGQVQFELDHKAIIDRFGRYPHRNQQKGRKSTREELAWLADVDNLPGWAK